MSYGDQPNHSDVLYDDDISAFLDYIEETRGIISDEDSTEEDRIAAQEELDGFDEDVIEQLRDILQHMKDTGENSAISEKYWEDYAREYADEIWGLDGTGASQYFDYEKFTEDFSMDFTEYVYDGVSYYVRD